MFYPLDDTWKPACQVKCRKLIDCVIPLAWKNWPSIGPLYNTQSLV